MSAFVCSDCGRGMTRAGVRCAQCWRTVYRRRTAPPPTHCIDCGTAITEGYRCAPCANRIVQRQKRSWQTRVEKGDAGWEPHPHQQRAVRNTSSG